MTTSRSTTSDEPNTIPLEQLDVLVFYETMGIRQLYYDACATLHQQPRELTPIRLGMRSVT
jgi:hypothetical protein